MDIRRSRIMMIKIEELLLERRIMRNLERLVGGRELETDYRLMQVILQSIYNDDGNPTSANIKQELRQVFPMVAAASPRRVRFIATCSYSTNICKDIMKAQVHVSKDFRYSDTPLGWVKGRGEKRIKIRKEGGDYKERGRRESEEKRNERKGRGKKKGGGRSVKRGGKKGGKEEISGERKIGYRIKRDSV
ncbi:hypothetical protein Tco_0605692 [Tanacetum coccineum]